MLLYLFGDQLLLFKKSYGGLKTHLLKVCQLLINNKTFDRSFAVRFYECKDSHMTVLSNTKSVLTHFSLI